MIFNTTFSNITVMKIAVPIPTKTSGTLTYNGNVQTPTWSYDSSLVQIVSGNSGTNAGSYNAVFSLADTENYMWADKTSGNKMLDWTIERATITNIPSQSGSLTYNGNVQSPTWNNYDSSKMTVSGTTSAIDADTYTIEFIPTQNYKWSDGSITAKNISWSISKKSISPYIYQAAPGLTYTGSTLTPVWANYNPLEVDISGDTSAVNAGTYTATFTPNKNCQWNNQTTTPINADWTIQKASISVVPSQSGSLVYDGNSLTPTWSNYDPNELTIGGYTNGVNAGNYTSTFTPTSNYKWWDDTTTSKDATWAISKADVTITVNPTTLSLDENNTSGEITVTRNSTGAITATSSDSTVATVDTVGNVVTVTGLYTGDIQINISVASDDNYNEGSIQVPVSSIVPQMYTVTADIEPNGKGTVSGTGTYAEGTQVTLTANPVTDYKFSGWKVTKSNVPDGYSEVDYVEFNNYTRVSTKVVPTNLNNTRIVMDMMPLEKVSSYRYIITGFFSTNPYSSPTYMLRQNNSSNSMAFQIGITSTTQTTGLTNFTYNLESNKRITIETNPINNTVKMGTSTFNVSPVTTAIYAESSICIGCGAAQALTESSLKMRVYSMQIYDGNTLIADFIPCKDSETGVYNLYNKVTGTITNTFNGGLSGGTEVPPDEEIISTDSTYTFTIDSDVHVTAVFKEIVPEYTITTSVNPSSTGTVSGSGVYEENSEVTLEATANVGYQFKDWAENGSEDQLSTNNPYSFLAVRDIDIVANFQEKPKLPTGYTELQYITNPASASNSVIDTGIIFDWSQDVIYEMDFSILSVPTNFKGFLYAFKSYSYSASGKYYLFKYGIEFGVNSSTCYLNCWNAKNSQESFVQNLQISVGNHNIKLDCKNTKVIMDSVDYTFSFESRAPSSSTYQDTLKIMGEPGNNAYSINGNLYSFKAYNENQVFHEYVPCTNPSGVVGVYDIVEEKFIQPGATFIAGPAV